MLLTPRFRFSLTPPMHALGSEDTYFSLFELF